MIPKEHHSHLSELPEELAGALGQAVSKVSNALTKGESNTNLAGNDRSLMTPH